MAALDGLDDPTSLALLLAGMAVLAWVLLRRSHRYFGGRRLRPQWVTTPRPRSPGEAGHHLTAPTEMIQWEVEMHKTARDLMATLDNKMSALEALIQDADRAAARLEAARRGEPAAPLRPADACREAVHVLADYGFSPGDIASRLGVDREGVERLLARREETP
ncbi:MAG: hypothetical protein JW809_00525 [Pirellulales bacterium]|nr:hypothetical protein [Pirellulales bacterium]